MTKLPVVTSTCTTKDENVAHVKKQLYELLWDAHILGVVVTVELESDVPLAMGNYVMRGHVRSAR